MVDRLIMDMSRLLTIPAVYLDRITHTLEPKRELAGLAPFLSGRIAEVFCRTGRLGAQLLAEGYQWQGCDPDISMIEHAIQRVGFSVSTTLTPAVASADTVIGLFAPLSYIPPAELPEFARAIHRALTEKGHALFELWFTPETAKPHYALMDTYEGDMHLVRAVVPTIEGSTAHFDCHWMVGSNGEVDRKSFSITRYLHSDAEIERAFSIFHQQSITIEDRSYLLLSKK